MELVHPFGQGVDTLARPRDDRLTLLTRSIQQVVQESSQELQVEVVAAHLIAEAD